MLKLKIVRIPEEPSFGALSIPLSATDYINSAKGKAKTERAIAMLLLKEALSELGVSSFGIEILPSGEPVLVGSKLHFSISHAGGLCALALSDTPVGIDLQDLETVSKIHDMSSFARRYFSADECRAFAEEPTAEQLCRIWTRKEALVKWLGEGMRALADADTESAEQTYGVRFQSYFEGDAIITLCHRANAVPPPTIRMCRADDFLQTEI